MWVRHTIVRTVTERAVRAMATAVTAALVASPSLQVEESRGGMADH